MDINNPHHNSDFRPISEGGSSKKNHSNNTNNATNENMSPTGTTTAEFLPDEHPSKYYGDDPTVSTVSTVLLSPSSSMASSSMVSSHFGGAFVTPSASSNHAVAALPKEDDKNNQKNTDTETEATSKKVENSAEASVQHMETNRVSCALIVSSANDEKTRARQTRKQAIAQQQRQQQQRSTTVSKPRLGCPGAPDEGPPPRRNSNTSEEDVAAKRRGRAVPETAFMTRRTTTMSSVSTHSSGLSTTVTKNTHDPNSVESAAAQAQEKVLSMILNDDSDDERGNDDENDDDEMDSSSSSKKRAARSSPQSMRRHSTSASGVVDVDSVAKQQHQRSAEFGLRSSARRLRRASIGSKPLDWNSHSLHSNQSSSSSQHSATSSVGAHSVTGGKRASEKSISDGGGGGGEEEEEDAVSFHLKQLASGIQFVPDDDIDYDNEGDMDSSHAKAVAKEAKDVAALMDAKMAATNHSSVNTIIEEEGEDLMDDIEEFAIAGSGDDDDDDDDEEEEEIAQAGVPVFTPQPGAFAVEGMNASTRQDEPFDDDWERETSVAVSHHSHNSAAFFDAELALDAEVPNDALEAELHVVVEGEVLTEDAEGLSAKAIQRLRMMQCTVFCLAIGAIASVVAVASSRPTQAATLYPWQQDVIPTIEGWTQVGNNLTGPTDDDKMLYGYAIAMAGHADRICIGVPGRDQSATELLVGEVHILDWNGSAWLPNGSPLIGPGPDGQAGTAVAMSKDGKRIAVGSPFLEPQGGHVAVYEEPEATKQWEIVGQVLVGNSSMVGGAGAMRFGSSLALSDDGSILAVAATMGENSEGGAEDSGYVKVFQLQEGNISRWVQLGDTIYGENPGDFFGWSLAISSSGTRIVAGAVGSDGAGVGEFAGSVRVFDYMEEDGAWMQTGPSISGLKAFDSFGSSVAMSGDGDTISVGAIGHSNAQHGVDIGHVRVFKYTDIVNGINSEPTWAPLGQTLMGQNAFDSFGYSVSLSEDGKVVAAGGPRNDEFSESSGQIQVFELTDEADAEGIVGWTRRGGNIGGSYTGRDLFGWSVALSADGNRLAGGAPFSPFDGRLNDVGTVRVYDVDSL